MGSIHSRIPGPHWINVFWKTIVYDIGADGKETERKLAFIAAAESAMRRGIEPGTVMSTIVDGWSTLPIASQEALHSAAILLFGEDVEREQEREKQRSRDGLR